MQTRLKQAGFSLFELIIVIVLIGIMATGAGMLGKIATRSVQPN